MGRYPPRRRRRDPRGARVLLEVTLTDYDPEELVEATSNADVAEWMEAIVDAVEGGYELTDKEANFIADVEAQFEKTVESDVEAVALSGQQLVTLRQLFDKVGE